MRKCPYCAEEIQDEAILCRYCGEESEPRIPNPILKCPACSYDEKGTLIYKCWNDAPGKCGKLFCHNCAKPTKDGISVQGQNMFNTGVRIKCPHCNSEMPADSVLVAFGVRVGEKY